MNPKRKKLYRALLIIAITIAVGIIANNYLRKQGNKISGEYLKELVKKESKGLYQLEFEEIDLNIFLKTVTIRNLELYATPENREDTINAKNLYEAVVDEVSISLESVFRIYTDKELVVDGIEVINPLVYMTKINPEKQPLKFGRETGELYDVISQYLNLLQINYLKVKSGTIDHSPSKFRLKSIDFAVENFVVADKKKQKRKKIFYSEAINLGVNQQSILLPDSIHQLSFDGFELSTRDSILYFNNFRINARDKINPKEVFQDQNQNIYDIEIPTLELRGINYLKAYEDNFLIVDQVNIPQPNIKIKSVLKSKKDSTPQAQNSIGASLLALFDLIKINDLRIQRGGLDLTLKGDNKQSFLSNNISIELFDISLDSTQRDIQNILNYFKDAEIEINDYDYLLPDNLHEIKFEKLKFRTLDSTLNVKNLRIKPSRNLDDSTLTQFNLNLPSLEMKGVAQNQIYENEIIDLDFLKLINGTINITPPYFRNSDEKKAVITANGLYGILGQYFKYINIDDFSIVNSNLGVGNFLTGEQINLNSESLKIDSTLNSWHQISNNTRIGGKLLNYDFEGNSLLIKNFASSKNLHNIKLDELDLIYQNEDNKVNSGLIELSGIQLDSIINYGIVQIDSIKLDKVDIRLNPESIPNKKDKSATNWKFSEKPINVSLSDSKLKYRQSGNDLSVQNFNLELNYLNDIEIIEAQFLNTKFNNKQLYHQLSAQNISLAKHSNSLDIKNVEIEPNQFFKNLKFKLDIPSIRLSNINKQGLFKSKLLEADSLIGEISNLNLHYIKELNKLKSKNLDSANFNVAFKNILFGIDKTDINIQNDEKIHLIKTQKSVITLTNFTLLKKQNANLFNAENFTFDNDKLYFLSPKKDSLIVNNFYYESFNEEGNIDGIEYIEENKNTQLTFNNIILKGADFYNLLEENQIKIDEISSGRTDLKIEIDGEAKNSLPTEIKLPFESVNIKKSNTRNINVKIYDKKKERNYYVRKADLFINGIKTDSIIHTSQIHKYINSFIFMGKNYKENFSHYTVTANDYSFKYPESNFEANNIKLRSKYSRFDYSQHIEYQNDWFKLDIDQLKLNKVKIDSILKDQKYMVDKLSVINGDFIVFRDLNVPHNRDRRVPMPQKILSELQFAFKVDTVFVNSDIKIHIVPKDASGIGTMSIFIDSGHIYNMRTHHFNSNEVMHLTAKGKLNNKANFNTKVDFPIPSTKSDFHFIGNIGNLNLTALNDMLIPLGAIEVRSGYNEEVNINFKGNDDYAEGKMEFRYNNLKIDILDRQTYQSKGFGNNLKTIFANSFIVSTRNPRWFKLQEGNIFFERIKSRSIFNLWAKALLSGAVSSIGIKKSKEEAKAYYKENKEEIDE
ncbi:hypothetical protein QYS48_32805 [Marivirga arenosa]|uniref:Uncharacterized protein n=1 Tax=Marivirga arenosa TaxID=3059076 RepID=A0AA51N8M2_9BACT|nr:hypothetical protein [Marivirga sp. ABR2-2]WMN06525.1 hypothetical protein QYS48_32805 [Marivirga sp. ABR2-2]